MPADPWAPDSDASFEPSPAVGFEPSAVKDERTSSTATASGGDGPASVVDPAGSTPGRRILIAVAVAAAVLVGSAVIVSRSSDVDDSTDAPAPSVLSVPESLPAPERTLDEIRREEARRDTGADVVLGVGDVPLAAGGQECSPERLPDAVDVRWSVGVDVAGHVSGDLSGDFVGVPLVSGGLAFVGTRNTAPNDPEPDPGSVTELVALDVVDGSERWRSDLGGAPGELFRVSAVVDDVVVVESSAAPVVLVDQEAEPDASIVVGLSAESGEELWRQLFEPGVRVQIDPVGSKVIVHRVVHSADSDRPEVASFDVGSGERLWSHSGVLGDVGRDGSVVVIGDTEIVWEAEQTSRFEMIGPGTRSAVVVGAALVVADGASQSLTAFERRPDGVFGYRSIDIVGVAGIDPPGQIERVVGLGDSSLIVEADGATYGANISGDTLELRWRRSGRLVRSSPSDRGLIVEIEANAAVVHDIVDASTGRTVTERSVDEVISPGLHANGVVVTEPGEDASTVVVHGLDLDGRERWTLSGVVAPAIGDRVVVDASPDHDPDRTDAVTVTAYGPLVDGPPRCGTVVREWITS